jgi:hypothetical protein
MQILSMLWPCISFTCRHARACAGRDKPGYDVGLLVLLSNPKVMVFFGAFIPQFMDMSRDHASQVVLLGITFMAIAAVTDGLYALLAGRAVVLLGTADAAAVAGIRRLHDRRRRLAGTDAGAVRSRAGEWRYRAARTEQLSPPLWGRVGERGGSGR